MAKAIITGVSGYIGSRVALEFKELGLEVVATARNPTARLADELGLEVHRFDALESEVLPLAEKSTCLIHCATANDILSRDFRAGVDLSVCGTWRTLELARAAGINQFIFLSTFQVYGTELNGVVDEETPVCCQSPYGLNHWFGEEACRLFSSLHGMSVAVVRPSNVYGAPAVSTVNRGTLVPMCFVAEAAQTGSITLRSSGKQRRNFVSTKEVADACSYIALNPHSGFRIFNVCSAMLASMREIAELTCAVSSERYGKSLDLKILGQEPAKGNSFEARSALEFLWPTKEESWARMRSEISSLFAQLQIH